MTILSALVLNSAFAADPSDAAAKVLEGLQLSVDIQLVDAGAEPRKVLKYNPKPGSVSEMEMVNSQSMQMEMVGPDGNAMPMGPMGDMSPVMTMGMRQEVGQPVANGFIPVVIGYTSMDVTNVPPEMKEPMLAGMKPLEGTSFRMLVNPETGLVEQIDVDSDTSDEVYQALQGMADAFTRQLAQFPKEAVGQGAKWTVDMDMNMGGLQLGATNHMTLTKIQGDQLEMTFDMVMNKGDSKMEFPGMPPGAEVDFKKFEATGSGTTTVNLATMATTTTSTTDMDLQMSMKAEGMNMGMNMKMKQKTEVRARK